MDKKKDNRGGARPNSGPKKATRVYSDAIKRDFLRAAKKKAKETGETLGEVIVGMIYNSNIQDAVRVGAFKAFADVIVVRESHKTEEHHHFGVAELPQREPDPADATEPLPPLQ